MTTENTTAEINAEPAQPPAPAAAKALSMAAVVAEAQEKTKGYLGRIEEAVDDSSNQCIAESHLDEELVGHGKRTVGKVSSIWCPAFVGGRASGLFAHAAVHAVFWAVCSNCNHIRGCSHVVFTLFKNQGIISG